MTRLVLFFLLFFSCACAEIVSIPQANISGLPNSYVNGVNVITGDYCDVETDMGVGGVQPLTVHRSYCSAGVGGPHQGWTFSYWHKRAQIKFNGKNIKAVVADPSGGTLCYTHTCKVNPHDKATLEIHPNFHKWGLTNCGSGELSGRSHPKNNNFCHDPLQKRCQENLSSGERRFFQYACDEVYVLDLEQKSNGNRIRYKISDDPFYPEITARSASGVLLGALSISRNKKDIYISGSDGSKVIHHFGIENKKKVLTSIERAQSPAKICYQYQSTPCGPRLCGKSFPDGRGHQIEYYHFGRNKVGDRLVVIREPTERDDSIDMSYNRVSLLREAVGPTSNPLITHRFFYAPSKYTEVLDALERTKRYHYSKESRLTAIESFTFEGGIQKTENFIWSEEGNLLCSAITDGKKTLYAHYYTYDSRGNVIENKLVGDLTGGGKTEAFAIQYTYDAQNLLTREIHPSGKHIEYVYRPGTSLLARKFTYENNKAVFRQFYEYDNNSMLVGKVTDDGSTCSKEDLTGVTERHFLFIVPLQAGPGRGLPGNIEEYAQGPQGPLLLSKRVRTYYPNGQLKCEQRYDTRGNAAGKTEYSYDALGQEISRKNPLGEETHFSYDANGNCTAERQGRRLTVYTYDFANRLISKTISGEGLSLSHQYQYDLGSQLTASIDPQGQATFYTYDALGHLIKTALPDQRVIAKEYDVLGNVTCHTDPMGYKTATTYNARGQPIGISYSDGTYEEYRYTLEGQVAHHRAKNGLETFYTYDFLGRLLKEETPFKTIECRYQGFHCIEKITNGQSIYYKYDFAGRLSEVRQDKSLTCYEYDDLGREFKVIEGETVVSVKAYDLLDRVIEERLEDIEGNIQKVTNYAYDELGHQIVLLVGEAATYTDYNILGHPIRITDALGEVTHIHYCYDFLNQGQRVLQVTTTTPLGHQTCVTYDIAGREASVLRKDPYGQVVAQQEHRYDKNGQRIQTRHTVFPSLRQVITEWHYVGNQLHKMIEAYGDPLQKTTCYKYNRLGMRESLIKPDGVSLEYRYDPLGRLSEFFASDDSFCYRYTYDAHDNLSQVFDEKHPLQRSYNGLNQLVEEKQGSLTLCYDYDPLGRPLKVTLPDSSSIRYGYAGIFLKHVSKENPQGEELYRHLYQDYDSQGRLLSATCIDGSALENRYDLKGRLVSLTHPFYSFEGEYDADNNLVHSLQGEQEESYLYDALYQLQQEGSHRYAYDSLYNRLQKDGDVYTVNALNQLVATNIHHYTYDLNGNLIDDGEASYTYDALDRLIAVEKGAEIIRYSYDSFNRRLAKTVNEKTIYYFYDGLNEIGTFEQEITELRVLGLGKGAEIGAAIAIELDQKVYTPLHDFRGHVAHLLDSEPVGSYSYTAFGEEKTTGVLSPWRFGSKRIDPHTGLINFGRRDYDPATGRWIEPDPIGHADGPNLYAYVLNSPLTRFDAYGLFGRPEETFAEMRSKYPEYYAKRDERKAERRSGSNPFYKIGKACVNFVAKIDVTGLTSYLQNLNNHSSVIKVGNGTVSNARATCINGIGNTRKDAEGMIGRISEILGNVSVAGIYDATHGFVADFFECILLKLGFATKSVHLLVDRWRELFQEMNNGTIHHFAHSQGALTTRVALKQLTPEERDMIDVVTLGGAAIITREECKGAYNYVSKSDLVPLLDIKNLYFGNANVVHLPCQSKNKWFDHGFNSPTYQNVLKEEGFNFIKKYGVIL